MTQTNIVEATCPQCGAIKPTELVQGIVADTDDHLREALFNGEINAFSCDSCGNEGFLEASILYIDIIRRFCVQYLPEETLRAVESFSDYSSDGKFSVALDLPVEGFGEFLREPHVVFDLDEMRRYITFRELLWERDTVPDE